MHGEKIILDSYLDKTNENFINQMKGINESSFNITSSEVEDNSNQHNYNLTSNVLDSSIQLKYKDESNINFSLQTIKIEKSEILIKTECQTTIISNSPIICAKISKDPCTNIDSPAKYPDSNPRKRKYTKNPELNRSLERTCKKSKVQKEFKLQIFERESILRKHMLAMHDGDEMPWRCVSCKETFPLIIEFMSHLKLKPECKQDQEFLVCYFCQDLKDTGNNFYYCNICMRTYESSKSLLRHWEAHKVQGVNFPCTFCPMSFVKQKHLTEHTKTEHKNVKQKCTVCGCLATNLLQHMKTIHFGKPFKCEHCSKEFTYLHCLQRHVLSKHINKTKLSCDICQWRAPSVFYIKKHMIEHDQNLDENGNYLPIPPTVVKVKYEKRFVDSICGPDESGVCSHYQDDLERQKLNVLKNSKFSDTRDLKFFVESKRS